MMVHELGEAAGRIWRWLEEKGETTITKLKQETKLSDQLLHMGLGWLARGGQIELVKDRLTVKVALRSLRVACPEPSSKRRHMRTSIIDPMEAAATTLTWSPTSASGSGAPCSCRSRCPRLPRSTRA